MACLVVIDGPATGAHFALADRSIVSVGRNEECTFQIIDPQMSRRHLQIRRESDGTHHAADYRSANGIKVNGVTLIKDVPLRDGDELTLGQSRVVYSSTDYDDAEQAIISRKGSQWRQSTLIRRD